MAMKEYEETKTCSSYMKIVVKVSNMKKVNKALNWLAIDLQNKQWQTITLTAYMKIKHTQHNFPYREMYRTF